MEITFRNGVDGIGIKVVDEMVIDEMGPNWLTQKVEGQ